MSNIKPLHLCDHCGYLEMGGYEYPEYYCSAGVDENDPLYVGEGCIYTNRQLKLKQEYMDDEPSIRDDLYERIFDNKIFEEIDRGLLS